MKILIDINHPAHVHFFKNLIWTLKKIGHEVIVTASLKEMNYDLLRNLKIDFIDLGSYGTSPLKKMMNVPIMALRMSQVVRKHQPNLLMGIGSSRICHGTLFSRKRKTWVFTDTEHSKEQIILFKPFANKIFSPDCFKGSLGKKQVLYPSYHELAYLHPNYFTPNEKVLEELNIQKNENFFVLRFVSRNATHDIGIKELNHDYIKKIIGILKPYGKIIISSETSLPSEFEKYRMKISPEKIHDLLYYAKLLYGESATMSSECAVLGTHSIFLDYAGRGYTDEQENKYNLVYNFKLDKHSIEASLNKLMTLVEDESLKNKGLEKCKQLLKDKVDVTQFILDEIDKEFKLSS